MPIEVEMRQKWDEILSKYRQTNGTLICMEHFNSNDLIRKTNECILKKDAIPSIFESANIKIVTALNADSINGSDCNSDVDIVTHDDNDVVRTDISTCEQCQILSDRLLAVNNRCTDLEKLNCIKDDKIRQLLEELEAHKNQLDRSDLARFSLNKDFVDEKVFFRYFMVIPSANPISIIFDHLVPQYIKYLYRLNEYFQRHNT